MNCKEEFDKWLQEHPDATIRDAFEAGWFSSCDAWCHGKRAKMEKVRELMDEIIN